MVAGPAEHTNTGPIIKVEPMCVRRPEYPGGPLQTLPAQVWTNTPRSGAAIIGGAAALLGIASAAVLSYTETLWLGLPIGAAVAALGGWQALRRQLRVEQEWTSHRVLTHHEDRECVRVAVSNACFTLHVWPQLQAAVALADPGPALASAVWEVTGILAERAVVRDAARKLDQAIRTVPGDSPVHADLASRLAQAQATQRRLDDQVQQRLGALHSLASEADGFIRQRQALAAARAVVRDVDQVLGAVTVEHLPPGGDPGAELAEQTAAVLAAYRELTGQDEA